MLLKCCTPYASKFRKCSSGHRIGKGQFSFQSLRKAMPSKECSNFHTIALISHASKVMLNLQARLQQYVNRELPDAQAGFRKGRGTRDQMTTSVRSLKKQESSRKTSTLTVWITRNCGKFFKLGFNSMWTVNFQMFKLDLEKAEEPEIKLSTSFGS